MSPQIIRRRLLLGGAVSALTITPSRAAQADTTFENFGFAATGAPTARTMPDRLSDIINVKDWGAKGDGVNDDTAAIQNAINYCISTAGGTKQPGGKVFFPAGRYAITNGSYLYVGSPNPNARVTLIGSGQQFGCTISGNYNGFLISQGTQPYDNLQCFEGIDVINGNTTPGSGAIKVTGTAVGIRNAQLQGMTQVDASQAQGCAISDIVGSGKDGAPPGSGVAGSLYPFSEYGVGYYLGNNCVAQNVRTQGANWIAFALSGRGAACIGCSCEVGSIGVRFGWVPGFNLLTSASAVAGATTLQFSAPLPGSVVAGLIVSGWNISDSTNIVSVNQGAGTIVISSGLSNALPSGSHVTCTVDTPAIGCVLEGLQTEAVLSAVELFNAEACLVQANVLTGVVGIQWTQDFTGATWNSGSHVVTVTTAAPHNLRPGFSNVPLLLQMNGGLSEFAPGTWRENMFTYCTYVDATHFTYLGPATNPGTFSHGNWTYPLRYSLRCRKVRDTAVISNSLGVTAAYAEVDFDYGATESPSANIHSNNVYIGNIGVNSGWNPPSETKNLAAWYFAQTGVQNLMYNSAATLPNLAGYMTFADLPGQISDPTGVYQPGPIEGQEYNIKDGQKSGGGAAAFADIVAGGGSGHYKVRYDGTNWRRCG